MIKTNYLSTCVPTHKVIQNKNKYIAHNTIPSGEYIKKITRLLCNFVWEKTERIKRNTIIGRIEEGGIGLVDIETKLKALKAAWVSRILNNNGLLCRYIQHLCTRNSVDINFLLKTTERNIKNFRMIEKFPLF